MYYIYRCTVKRCSNGSLVLIVTAAEKCKSSTEPHEIRNPEVTRAEKKPKSIEV